MRRCFLPLILICAASAQQLIGTVEAQNTTLRGAVTINGSVVELRSGAQIATNEKPASIKLARGGSLRICPRTSLQLTASPSGKELLIALDSGAVETDYSLTGSADSVMTADFQLQLTGPGTFHYAIGAQQSQLCTRALAGANASVIVAETLGSGTYQVRPAERASFKNGSVANAETESNLPCGCPETMIASTPPELGFPEQQSQAAAKAIASGEAPPEAPPLTGVPETTSKPDETITQVSVPLAFKGGEQAAPKSAERTESPIVAAPVPEPVTDANLAALPKLAQPVVAPPPKPSPKKNWFKRLLGKLFR